VSSSTADIPGLNRTQLRADIDKDLMYWKIRKLYITGSVLRLQLSIQGLSNTIGVHLIGPGNPDIPSSGFGGRLADENGTVESTNTLMVLGRDWRAVLATHNGVSANCGARRPCEVELEAQVVEAPEAGSP